jgi:hypothetical protein
MHYKRRRRRKGGVKGHCGLCSRNRNWGKRNQRLLTRQEKVAKLREKEQKENK